MKPLVMLAVGGLVAAVAFAEAPRKKEVRSSFVEAYDALRPQEEPPMLRPEPTPVRRPSPREQGTNIGILYQR